MEAPPRVSVPAGWCVFLQLWHTSREIFDKIIMMEKRGGNQWIVITTLTTALVAIIVVIFLCKAGGILMVGQSCEGKGNVCGRVMSQSDVTTLRNSPLQGEIILAVPRGKFDLLLEEVGVSNKAQSSMARLGLLNVSKEIFEKFVVASTISQQNGDYRLWVPPDKYLLCLATASLRQQPENFPVGVYGCIEVTVPEGKQVFQNIFLGLGGVTPQ